MKRFGRNQKRKMQAEIDTLKCNLSRANQRTAEERVASAEYHSVVKHLADTVDKHSIFFPPQLIKSLGAPHHYSLLYPDASRMLATVTEIGILRTSVEEDPFDKSLHVRVTHPEFKTTGYAITRTTLCSMPRDALISRISYELALALEAQL